jgi:glutamate---cysteine ligase / carboxylate-amine ligase
MFRYRLGIEEEYFVVDRKTRNVRRAMPRKFFRACKIDLKDRVTTELLQSQIEVSTQPCTTMAEARAQIGLSRSILADHAARYGLAIAATATHPLAVWRDQKQTENVRYDAVMTDIQMLGLRNMLCGMHVHVEIPDPERRVEVMFRSVPFLPLLLALSTSSPFWEGHRTGLLGYRLAAYDELPRTGLPEPFRTAEEYQRYVDTLVAAGVIKDASFIWWAIRPSLRHPTLELRIADVCTRMEDAVCIAAIYRCLVRHLVDHPEVNRELDVVDRAFAEENKWRAQRYGTAATFVDRRSTATPIKEAVEKLVELIREDAEALDCSDEIHHANEIVRRGSSANEQVRIYAKARIARRSRTQALRDVVDWLCQTTVPSDLIAAGTPSSTFAETPLAKW